jgi:predicted nucleic acid-binding protein
VLKDPVLVDTWALISLANTRDAWHERVVEVSALLDKVGRPLVTTEWIMSEFLAFMARPPARDPAVRMVDSIRASTVTEVVQASHEAWERGFQMYRARPDKAWSLVDCISVLVCEELRIEEVFTRDHHFEQAGLRILVPHSDAP